MTDANLARALAWLDPVLADWFDEWPIMPRVQLRDALAACLGAAVEAKGFANAALLDNLWGIDTQSAKMLRIHAADVPPAPQTR